MSERPRTPSPPEMTEGLFPSLLKSPVGCDSLVTVDYKKLLDAGCDVSADVEAAFGPDGLGIIAVKNVPGYDEARARLLPLAEKLEQLPDAVKAGLEDPGSNYSFGWSMGKESLSNGRPDTRKCSFYANPIHDVPTADEDLKQRYPVYCHSNIWPSEDLPQLEPAFKGLGNIIVDVGSLLVEHCERYVAKMLPPQGRGQDPGTLTESLKQSKAHKARLLLYIPEGPTKDADKVSGSQREDSQSAHLWCDWHLDHGSLTGLTRAMYRRDGQEADCPDRTAGLHIQKQNGQVIQVRIPEGCIAFQMGQAMSIMSGGLLCATPHCVQAPRADAAAGMSRSTFAVFMQPMWGDHLTLPEGTHPSDKVKKTWGPWKPGMTFGDFSERVVSGYYGQPLGQPWG